jgi:hypothetical protein
MKEIRMLKRRETAIMFAFVLSTFACSSLCAQITTPAMPNEPVTAAVIEEAQLQNQPWQSEQAQRPSPPPQNQFSEQGSVSQTGIISGTVTDVSDTPVPRASVALQGPDAADLRSVTTNENGYFEIRDVEPGRPYRTNIRATGFSEWESPVVTLDSGQSQILNATL